MQPLAEYQDRYPRFARLHRDVSGVLEVTFHSDGGPWRWTPRVHRDLPNLFRSIADDSENRVVILTGTGDEWCGPVAPSEPPAGVTATIWDQVHREGRALLMNLLDIGVPVIAAVNGPAVRHAEIPLLSDIVLAAPEATFQDSAHFPGGLVPGDGVHVVFPMLLGPNRGRYVLLTGAAVDAQEAHRLGLVAEILPRERLLPRARQLAAEILTRPPLVARYSRLLLTHSLRRELHELLSYGLALEGLGAVAASETG